MSGVEYNGSDQSAGLLSCVPSQEISKEGCVRLLPILYLSWVSILSAQPLEAFAQGLLAVGEARLSEMLSPALSPAAQQVASAPASAAQSSSLPLKTGVYLYQEGNYGEVEPEVLTLRDRRWPFFKTWTNDLVTVRRYVRLDHPHSHLQLSPGAELLLVLPQGASPTEYRLLRLDEKKDRREFQVQFRWRELKQTQSDVTVTITPSFWPLGFWPRFHDVFQGRTDNITLNLSDPAPTSGLTLNLSMDNTAVATVPSSVIVGAGQVSVQVPVTGQGVGKTTLRASGTGIAEATATITTEPDPEDAEEAVDTAQDQHCYMNVRCTSDVIFLGLGGMDKYTVRFDAQEVAPRTYKIRLPPLRKGEYGFFPPSDAVGESDVIDLGNLTPEYLRTLSGGMIFTFGIK